MAGDMIREITEDPKRRTHYVSQPQNIDQEAPESLPRRRAIPLPNLGWQFLVLIARNGFARIAPLNLAVYSKLHVLAGKRRFLDLRMSAYSSDATLSRLSRLLRDKLLLARSSLDIAGSGDRFVGSRLSNGYRSIQVWQNNRQKPGPRLAG
ncbi:hypothetical protein LZ30DRAFT_298097 [Colletotrichum cereale]|nr:hypothetical protein LZ30DRAFT_298097 [Colletotrichum cereale]